MADDVFGDFDPDDSWGTEPPDPEQVARKLHTLAAETAALRGYGVPRWEALDDDERQVAIDLLVIVIAWLRRQGALVS
jgi:hypothetical protein